MRQTTLTILAIIAVFSINAQTIITGTVSDITGPLPFVNVSVSGTNSGTITDVKGDFTIEANKEEVLTISYVGYTSKSIRIDSLNHYEIYLDIESLDEVVITGYGTYSKHTRVCYGISRAITCEFPGSHISQKISHTFNESIIKTYPNPTSTGYITIEVPEQYTSLEMSVHSITGQRIIHQTYDQPKERLSIDLSRFSTGVYIINMVANGEPLPAQKVIKT